MLISIITASLNSAQTIGACIASIKNQSFSDFEHIVCDGGSGDDTVGILRAHQVDYPLQWTTEADTGIADALNKAFEMTQGRYVIVIQADDVLIEPHIFEYVAHCIINERYDIYSFPVIRDRPNLGPFSYRAIRLPGWYRFRNTIPHQGAFVHRRVFDKIGGFRADFSIVMDYDFFYRAFQAGMKIKFEKQHVAVMGGSGVSSNPSLLKKRIMEEFRVQRMNERNPFWSLAQSIFQKMYCPYKTKFHKLHHL